MNLDLRFLVFLMNQGDKVAETNSWDPNINKTKIYKYLAFWHYHLAKWQVDCYDSGTKILSLGGSLKFPIPESASTYCNFLSELFYENRLQLIKGNCYRGLR